MKHPKKWQDKKQYALIGVVLIAVVALFLLLLPLQSSRQPDARAFCELYQSTNWTNTDRKEEITVLKELERLAPDEIYPAIHSVREAWQKAEKNPAGAMAIELDVSGSSAKLRDWAGRCSEEKDRVSFCSYYEKHKRPNDDPTATENWLRELQKHDMPTEQFSKANAIVSDYQDAQRELDGFFGENKEAHDRYISKAKQAVPELIEGLETYCSKSFL